MPSNRQLLLPLLAALALLALTIGASACGSSEEEQGNGTAEGEPVKVGALSVNVTSSRYLNRREKVDAAYLVGQPPAGKSLSWFGVFLEMKNESDKAKRVPAITITDATGRTYSAFPSESPQALHFGEAIEPNEQLPKPDTTGQDPAEGALVIFRLGEAASRNRPLTLHIEAFHRQKADVTLDF